MKKKYTVPSPPMGWNSWDCYGAAVTEEELIANADYMAEHLKEYGWEYVVCDIQWYEPTADSSSYHALADLCMDEYGRLIPAPNRFPSAAEGAGFKPIADYIHGKGLKFGIHIMRGIPRQAVFRNTPVMGTSATAREVAHPHSRCVWNTDMYGLNPAAEGAQEYYDSIFKLYASWGVDFVKVDDICVVYKEMNGYCDFSGKEEIRMISTAIRRCGRDIVLSLSPGPAFTDQAEFLSEHAVMWRMTNDLWDRWDDIVEIFERCREWAPLVTEGSYPDCDMIPLGHLSIRGCEHGLSERTTLLTKPEQITLMTLWCIFRSPLMIGSELRDLDEWTKGLLTNPEVLGVHRKGHGAREVMNVSETIVWKAEDEDGRPVIAIFHTGPEEGRKSISLDVIGLEGRYQVRDLWKRKDIGTTDTALVCDLEAHGAGMYRLSPEEERQ